MSSCLSSFESFAPEATCAVPEDVYVVAQSG